MWTDKQTVCNNLTRWSLQTIEWDEQEFAEVRTGIFATTVPTPKLTATLNRCNAGSSGQEHQHPQNQGTHVIEGT